jgi:putative ATP-binding cassette transporter
LLRVASFRGALATMDSLGETASRIDLKEHESSTIRIDELCVAAPETAIHLSESHLELKPGERVLIAGERGAERTLFFRAMIGLWPWGSGQIRRPPQRSVMFLPGRAYVPPGTLRAALCYPCSTGEFEQADTARALAAVGLEHLQGRLDTAERWDRQLNDDEKQSLALARVILQRPQWLVMNGVFESLDPASRRRIEALLTGELEGLGVIDVGKGSDQESFFTRRLRLATDPQGPTFSPSDRLATATP